MEEKKDLETPIQPTNQETPVTTPVVDTPTPSPTTHSSRKKLFLIGILVAVTLGGGYFLWQNSQKQTAPSTSPFSTPESNTAPQNIMLNDYEVSDSPNKPDWNLFKSKTYNFEIQYPGGWSIESEDQSCQQGYLFNATASFDQKAVPHCSNNTLSVAINLAPLDGKNMSEWIEENIEPIIGQNSIKQESIKDGENTFTKVTECSLGCYDKYLIIKDNKMWIISTYSDVERNKIYKEILSTFKFTK